LVNRVHPPLTVETIFVQSPAIKKNKQCCIRNNIITFLQNKQNIITKNIILHVLEIIFIIGIS
jgi:hypothetical protein